MHSTTMPNTRSGNKSANFKAYYSKKAAPYQQHFPHRRKIVRRPDPHDDSGKKQMKFLPEIMRRRGTVQDSDDEGEESVEDMEVDAQETHIQRRGKKRNSDVMRELVKEEEDEEPVRPKPKRVRQVAPVDTPQRSMKRRRAATPVTTVPDEDDGLSDSTLQEEVLKPSLRRQSTMTQIVDGRSPLPGSMEPEFKPVKRTPRTSWGGNGTKKDAKKDVKQRTLTQMVHHMTPLVFESDEDIGASETDEEVDAAHRSFIFGNDEVTAPTQHAPIEHVEEEILPTAEGPPQPAVDDDDSGEDEYQPTQFIESPTKRTRRAPLRSSTRHRGTPAGKPPTKTSSISRFGLLSTPEKRGVFEIPSSQSPPETMLSTQITPQRSGRQPLKRRSANAPKTAETPSKRGAESPSMRKQVTFQAGPQEHILPPALKKFTSTIPDSEDELEDLDDSDGQSDADYGVGDKMQALLRNVDKRVSGGVSVGAETQAMLLEIDRACANAEEDAEWTARDESEELGDLRARHLAEESQGLGQQPQPRTASTSTDDDRPSDVVELPPLPFSSPKPRDTLTANDHTSAVADTLTMPLTVQQLPSSPPVEDFRTQPPTPMFADDGTPEEEEEPATTTVQQRSTPTKQPRSSPVEDFRTQPTIPMFNDDEPSEDLNVPAENPAAPCQPATQVSRSPPTRLHHSPSHSSQAEQQLHSEYQSYSQFRRPGPFPSSMHVAHESNYSYQATPHPFPSNHQLQLQSEANHISQATTVDPTQISPKATPKKPRVKKEPMFTRPTSRTPKRHKRHNSATTTPKTQRQNRSATTTPTSLRQMVMSSPEASKPPPLFIPSSFPSPARVTLEGWSSPVLVKDVGESQWGHGSLEDFSIPAPPPGEWVDDDDVEQL
ncbi:hypothetical protein SLS60_010252 [Paraconiothyrium brasiliense]|uniref:Uncharacterized protein n=1 Tax=Paraconiothyrium brasiliense TaxID=300254 RepID=A0ABR3QRQ6_9PLEO